MSPVLSPQERVNKLVGQRFQSQPILTLKFEVTKGMRLVKEHIETAAALIGIQESGLVLGMMIEFNFAKLLMNKQTVSNLSEFVLKQRLKSCLGLSLLGPEKDREEPSM